jgi:tetratricopeptide (TPR) repeat protein
MNAAVYEEGLKLSGQGRHAEAIERFERALALAPDDARVLFALGNTARALGLGRAAEAFFRRVLAAEPDRLEALVNLANLLRAQGDFAAAEALLAPALQRRPSPELWLTLGSVHRERGARDLAIAHYRAALALKPDYPQALGNLADLLDDPNEALALYDRALKLDGTSAQARMNRAILHFLKGDLKAAWRDYAARLKLPGKVPVATHGLPRWDGTKGKRLLVTAEQGVGDQVMFASLFGELGSCVIECEPRLVTLFARSFPNAKLHGWDAETRGGITTTRYGWLKSVGGAQVATEMGTLPRHLRRGLDDFPARHAYLLPDPEEVEHWRTSFGPAIGICWRSGKSGGHRALQYAPLEAWADFARAWPGAIVSVQYDATADEIAQLEALSGRRIVVPEGIDQKDELDRACALLRALDAVVSAPTAVSWLASGAGVPTFKVLHDTSWTSFGRAYEPFAPSCRCVGANGDWASCFAKIRTLLAPA